MLAIRIPINAPDARRRLKVSTMTTSDYILIVVRADGPCSLRHVLADCKQQGFTAGFVKAFQSLKDQGLIYTETDEEGTTVSLV